MKRILFVLLVMFLNMIVSSQVETRYSDLTINDIKFKLFEKIEKEINKIEADIKNDPTSCLNKDEKKYLKENSLDDIKDINKLVAALEEKKDKEKNNPIFNKILEKINAVKEGKSEEFLDSDYKAFLESQGFKKEKGLSKFIEDEKKKLENLITKEVKKESVFEFFNQGFIEYGAGVLKGSVRLLKYRIGEPCMLGLKRFSLPIYVFVSAKDTNSALSIQKDENVTTDANVNDLKTQAEKNKEAFLELLDPLGGTINFSIAQKLNIVSSKLDLTHLSIYGHLGGKVTRENAENKELGKITKLNGFASIGFFFDTGAWKDGEINNMGRFYLQSSLGFLYIGEKQNNEVFNNNLHPITLNWATEMGIYIKDSINLKFVLLKCFVKTADPNFDFLNQFYFKAGLAYSFNQ